MTDHKSQKYDRQLRLWGEHGQAALERSKVCLINATAVGTETLKNLVLPGIGSFTIIDGKRADGADVGNNFFLERSSLGQPRGKVATELLKEMNEDVIGHFLDEDPKVLIDKNSEIFAQFTIVVATDLPEKSILRLSSICWNFGVPLVVIRCYGLFAYLRVAIPEHTVVESHPDNPSDDLRLDVPFPELQKKAEALDLSQMDTHQRSHVPYLLLLLKAASMWKAQHEGKLPSSSAEKDEFRTLLRSFGNEHTDQNVAEAVSNAHKIWVKTSVPSDARSIFETATSKALDSKTSDFWFLARAVSDFVNASEEGNGFLPLQGSIPDMHSDTKSYTDIQQIYQAKAKQDIVAITSRVHNLLAAANRAPDSIKSDFIKTFCKNASRMCVLRYRPISDEYDSPKGSYIGNSLEDQENNLKIYVLLRAASHFEEQYRRLPGIHDEEVEGDIVLLKKSVQAVLSSLGVNNPNAIKDEIIHEMCRFGAAELHNIAAFMGGVGSQEVIKLLTHQFVPVNNTFLFNGINGTCLSEEL